MKVVKFLKSLVLVALILSLFVLTSCGNTNQNAKSDGSTSEKKTRIVVDMKGNEIEIPEKVNTYVDSWFAHNSISVLLKNAEGMVVTCCNPKEHAWMFKVSDNMYKAKFAEFSATMNLEEIISLKPDVVFGSNEKYREMFNNVGLPFINCSFTNFDEMKKSIKLTAEVFGGSAIDKADKYIEYLDKKLKEVKEITDTVHEEDRTTIVHGSTLYEMGVDGKNTIIDEWINYSGGINLAASDIDGNLKTMTLEQLLVWDPDVLITGRDETEVEKIMTDEGWKNLKAVKNNRVYANPRGVFAWDRYGFEEALQFQWCAKILYPELFEYLDIKKELIKFYKDFLGYNLSESDAEKILKHQDP